MTRTQRWYLSVSAGGYSATFGYDSLDQPAQGWFGLVRLNTKLSPNNPGVTGHISDTTLLWMRATDPDTLLEQVDDLGLSA
jgi:hypothetical protein